MRTKTGSWLVTYDPIDKQKEKHVSIEIKHQRHVSSQEPLKCKLIVYLTTESFLATLLSPTLVEFGKNVIFRSPRRFFSTTLFAFSFITNELHLFSSSTSDSIKSRDNTMLRARKGIASVPVRAENLFSLWIGMDKLEGHIISNDDDDGVSKYSTRCWVLWKHRNARFGLQKSFVITKLFWN